MFMIPRIKKSIAYSTENRFAIFLLLICFSMINWSCEDVIDPDLEESDPVLNIDAWVNDKSEAQVIQVNWSVDYDDNTNLPPPQPGCTVTVSDNAGNQYVFIEDTQKNDGTYVWKPTSAGEKLGAVGRTFSLTVQLPAVVSMNAAYNGQVFTSTSSMGPVPPVDSVTYEFEEASAFNGNNDGYRAEFWGTDILGTGNAYWIRTYKTYKKDNKTVYLNKASEINLAYDAGISIDGGFDGLEFLPPIRSGINPNEVDENDSVLPAYVLGDSIYVEIHSITRESFDYLNEVIDNTNRQTGIGALFSSTPLANVSTNIVSTGPTVVGFFNVASVKGNGVRIR